MKIDANILNHNPVPLEPLADILGRLQEAGRHHAIIYLHAKYTDGSVCEHGWVGWRSQGGGLFTDPFEGTYFFLDDLNVAESVARLLQPNEQLIIKYTG